MQSHVIARVARHWKPLTMPLYPYAQHKGKRVEGRGPDLCLDARTAASLAPLREPAAVVLSCRARKSRGQFSEVDTEAFAVNRLRAWRRSQKPVL